ncbi:FMN-binding protein [Dactylosporangium sp. NPDC005572]|uniref:FMN-binding protein n=1 Tax=Dactylosporangium sp. NPDC005572 TaxID=3156889 RepID=UPI00339E3214
MRRVGVALLGTGLLTGVLIAMKSQTPAPPAGRPPADGGTGSPLPAAASRMPEVGVVDLTRMTDGPHLGAVFPNRYGPVQVRITVRGGRLVDVEAVQLPAAAARGIEIGRRATPVLRQQALQRQSADLDAVSGATYTSDGYRRSLQSAIDAARAGRPAA